MIELNLLPDIKLTYIKTRRTKRLVTSVAFLVGAAALIIFIFLLVYVDVVQKSKINTLNTKIDSTKSQLVGNSSLNKVLTIQKQLQTLPVIESQLPVTSRLYGYLAELIPTSLTVSSLQVSFTLNTATLSGNAKDIASVNQFVDTLKFSTFSDAQSKSTPAFSNVVLSSFSLSSSTGTTSQASYSVTLAFNPKIFSPTENIQLTVPSITTTRSIVNQPTDLFKTIPTKTSGN